ncbi:CdaR family protein [Clostridium beijerinckii]|uniref:YbbR domain-containing protein n=1 Tax=Clostridium beijerinckii TaxID=1520 RepID=A0AAX0B562_CLOBE|nr:CdaR family protein [Clostridium beijerinckii]MBA8936055.1 YbbR domain-containing protein [Clostridium beijerinckii]NRT90349.1 YbbR domain-containing protein [Clostridium beijerinckii]NRU36128.1 YbbR domain-containing protein [Clostridium beijerinckii]NSB00592.1 YbbR domain-containing protein [Clostridium beijerinckii]NYC69874.1 YbbR domain-containing protein [Clostridium beijerinckii]
MDKSENGTLIVKIICLLLSVVLWLYISNVENPLRTYELKGIPVELTNEDSLVDSKFAIVNKQPFTVDLKLEGPSSEILKVKKEDFKIVADMSAYALKVGENTIPVQIMSYPENITIKNNGMLGIKVNLEELTQKELTISSKVKVTYKENIYEKEQSINPKTVTITGGKSSVDKVTEAILTGEEKDVDKNKQGDYNIQFIDSFGNAVSNIESNIKTAKLSITVTNGKTVPVNLKTTGNVPQGFVLDGYELSKNNVTVLGDSQILNKLESIDTEAVDMSSLQPDSEVDVKLNLPEGISIGDGDGSIKAKFKLKKEENTTKNIECNVQYKNLSDVFLVTNQSLVSNVKLSGTQEALDKISSQNISVILDLANVKEEGTFDYTPQATLVNANNVTVSDVGNVSVTIKKKG